MQCVTEETAAGARLRLVGEMTIYAAAELKPRLLDEVAAHAALEIDLAEVSEIDTAGIQLLLLAKREAAAAGKTLALVGHSPAVLELVELYKLAGTLGDPLVLPAGTPSHGGQ